MAVPYYEDNHVKIYNKDCRDMSELLDGSVQMVCTSPPYWGLRKYSGEQELIWGSNHCEHQWGNTIIRRDRGKATNSEIVGQPREMIGTATPQGSFCSLCGAWKGAYGLEPTPEMYIEHTIEILREIRRVLRKDGVVFWNIGDSYAGSWGSMSHDLEGKAKRQGTSGRLPASYIKSTGVIKPKDLCLIPFRLAIACQEDGWWVRSIIIWSKPNPMPESVTDRPTESHEYLLMLTQSGESLYWTHRDGGGTRQRPKADYRWVNQITGEEVSIEPPDWRTKIKCPVCEATGIVSIYLGLDVWQDKRCDTCYGKKETQLWKRINLWKGHDYYWDADAVREPYSPTERWGGDIYKGSVKKGNHGEDAGLDRERSVYPQKVRGMKTKGQVELGGQEQHHGLDIFPQSGGRNIRSVWEFPTTPYPEAHFAVFPEKLPEICIKAATPEVGCCNKCGAPWDRQTQVIGKQVTEAMKVAGCKSDGDYEGQDLANYSSAMAQSPSDSKRRILESMSQIKESTWYPTCQCNADKVPSIVLDNCGGTGTVAWVAKKLNRRCYIYEISEEYCVLGVERNRQGALGL